LVSEGAGYAGAGDAAGKGLKDVEKGDVLAEFDGRVITKEDMERIIDGMREGMRDRFNAPAAKKNLLNSMVELELLYDECKKRGLDKDGELLAKVEEFKKSQAANDLRERFLEDVKVSDDEVRKEYEKQIDRYKTPKRVRVSQIVFMWDKGASEGEIASAERQAGEVLGRVRKGEDFSELARSYSLDQASAKKGGDIGFVNQRLTPPHVYEAAMKLEKEDDVSGLVKGPQDVRIIKATEVEEEQTKPLKEVKPWLERSLLNGKQREAWTEYIEGLKEKAGVKVYEDRLAGKDETAHGENK
jgi:parvulin-like peptidyl-prolyl isomerase